jgi:antitoxin ParD1/3/4
MLLLLFVIPEGNLLLQFCPFGTENTLAVDIEKWYGRNNSYRTTRPNMPTVEKISIALPPEMAAQLRQAVATGEYASSSEVVRDALRDWTHKRQLQQNGIAELRTLWQKTREKNGPYVPAEEVMKRLERKYQAIADAAGETG